MGSNVLDMLRSRTTTATHNINEAIFRPPFNFTGHLVRGFIIFTQLIGQADDFDKAPSKSSA